MAVRQILELRLRDLDAFGAVQRALVELVASHREALAGHVELGRTEDGRAFVFVTAPDPETLSRWVQAVVEPWLSQCRLAHPPVRPEAAIVWSDRDLDEPDAVADDIRVDRFVATIRDSETVWGLYGTTWARADVGADVEALPFWSTRAAAARCIAGQWAEYVPRAIDLDAFVGQWLAGMIEDGIVVVVAPGANRLGSIVDPAALLEALAED